MSWNAKWHSFSENTASFLKKNEHVTFHRTQQAAPGRLSQRNEDTAHTRMEECSHIHTRMFPGALLVTPHKLETTQISSEAQTQTVLRPYHGILFLSEKDQTADVYNNLKNFGRTIMSAKHQSQQLHSIWFLFFKFYQPLLQIN